MSSTGGTIQYIDTIYKTEDLQLGFVGKHCSFEHRKFEDRTPKAQHAYMDLRVNLFMYGMKYPLITYKGHVLIGMRRFEILKSCMYLFRAYEITENVDEWIAKDIKRLTAFKNKMYGTQLSEFME